MATATINAIPRVTRESTQEEVVQAAAKTLSHPLAATLNQRELAALTNPLLSIRMAHAIILRLGKQEQQNLDWIQELEEQLRDRALGMFFYAQECRETGETLRKLWPLASDSLGRLLAAEPDMAHKNRRQSKRLRANFEENWYDPTELAELIGRAEELLSRPHRRKPRTSVKVTEGVDWDKQDAIPVAAKCPSKKADTSSPKAPKRGGKKKPK